MEDSLKLAKKLCPEMVNVSFFTMYNVKNFNNQCKSFSRFHVTNNLSGLNDDELKQFQKYFYKKCYLCPKFLIKFILKQSIFAALNWRKFISKTLKFLC